MSFHLVRPDDVSAVAQLTQLCNTAGAVDDPDHVSTTPELMAGELAYGWELQPGRRYLYCPPGAGQADDTSAAVTSAAVGFINVDAPTRDNQHLVTGDIVVHPDHRRRGHGSAMMAEILRRTGEWGRTTVWAGCAADDAGAAAFLTGHGFSYASHDARRFQWPAELDTGRIDDLHRRARAAAADYDLIRAVAPTDDQLLTELVEVTAAINDAPTGDLDFRDEVFDLQRLRDFETAARSKGERLYRIFARHRDSGAVGGHTVMMIQPARPAYGNQYDTAVHRDHRGHRLGLLLKIEMMHWLAEVEPQLERIETWNNADNRFMIDINEAIGYRLSRVFHMYQRTL